MPAIDLRARDASSPRDCVPSMPDSIHLVKLMKSTPNAANPSRVTNISRSAASTPVSSGRRRHGVAARLSSAGGGP